MTNNYSRFFSIELGHEYFLNRTCPDLAIIPTPDCQALFRRLRVHWRQTGPQFVTMISENKAHEPAGNVPPHQSYRADYGQAVFRFYVMIKDPTFLNYTNIDLHPRQTFYFSNLARNAENNFLYLTVPGPAFAPGQLYLPGRLVRDARTGQVYEANKKHISQKKSNLTDPTLWTPKGFGPGIAKVAEFSLGKNYQPGELVRPPQSEEVFEAVRQHTSTGEAQLNDPAFWLARGQGQLQYPTANDQLEYCSNDYTFPVTKPVTTATITIFKFNYQTATPAYNVPVGLPETRTFAPAVTQIPVKLAHLPPGKYHLKINDETRPIYYDPLLRRAGPVLGVIEIFNHLPGHDAYALLTDEEKIKKINYRIEFPTRRVLWKYVRKDARAQTITDTGPTNYQFQLTGDNFVSTSPIPLTESPLKTLKLEFNTADFKLSPLPNPAGQRFGKCTQDDYDYICAEMYLNY